MARFRLVAPLRVAIGFASFQNLTGHRGSVVWIPLCCWCRPSLCSLSHRRRLVWGFEVSVSHGYPGCKPSDNKEAVQHYVNGASVGALCLLLTADIFLVLVEEAEGGVLHDRWSLTEMVFNFIDDRGRR